MDQVPRITSPLPVLILVVAAGLAGTWIQNRAPAAEAGPGSFRQMRPCPETSEDDCDVTARASAVADVVLSTASVCSGVGYLCAEVESIRLAVRDPGGRNYQRTADGVLLTAAHEMGHALGLSHSDSERDVMYRTNTARSLTPRDFRMLAGLYRLPFLATIKKNP